MNVAAQALTAQIHQAFLSFIEIEQKWNVLADRPEHERCGCYDAHIGEVRGKMQAASAAVEALVAKRAEAPWMGA